MQEIDRIDQAIAENPFLNIGVPSAGIDLRRILLGVRSHIPHKKLIFSSTTRADVFVPTLREKFVLIPHDKYLVVKAKRKIKVPMVMDGNALDKKIVDIIVAWIEHIGINDKVNY